MQRDTTQDMESDLMHRIVLLVVALAFPRIAYTQGQGSSDASSDSSFRAFLSQWERAQGRFINGDPSLWKQNASHETDVTIFGAFGGHEKGWNEVGPRNDWASSQFKDVGSNQTIEYLNARASGDLAFTVSIERQVAQLTSQEKPTARALRVTQIFRREGGKWKLVHRHADPLVERLSAASRRD
jgi:ketosteroid isomerase-like protein